MKRRLLAFVAAYLVLSGCSADLTDPEMRPLDGDAVPFEQITSAILSPIDSPTYRVILDQESWADAWSRLVAGHAPPEPPPPTIDFATRIVIFTAAGALPTQLRSFRIEEVRLRSGVLHVTVHEAWPAPQCGSLPVITRPVDIVSIPRLATKAEFLTRRTSSC
jgi:hypothetical protein